MSTFACDPSLRESLEALLANVSEPGSRFRREILTTLDRFLEPGELLLAYAGCQPLEKEQTDAFAYTPGGPKRQTDAFDYRHDEPTPQTDVFAYDTERARRQPDVMGYEPWRRPEDTDVLAYPRPRPTPDNDAFMSPRSFHPVIHFLLLTDRRLIDGIVDGGALVFSQALNPVPVHSWVQTAWAPAD